MPGSSRDQLSHHGRLDDNLFPSLREPATAGEPDPTPRGLSMNAPNDTQGLFEQFFQKRFDMIADSTTEAYAMGRAMLKLAACTIVAIFAFPLLIIGGLTFFVSIAWLCLRGLYIICDAIINTMKDGHIKPRTRSSFSGSSSPSSNGSRTPVSAPASPEMSFLEMASPPSRDKPKKSKSKSGTSSPPSITNPGIVLSPSPGDTTPRARNASHPNLRGQLGDNMTPRHHVRSKSGVPVMSGVDGYFSSAASFGFEPMCASLPTSPLLTRSRTHLSGLSKLAEESYFPPPFDERSIPSTPPRVPAI